MKEIFDLLKVHKILKHYFEQYYQATFQSCKI